MTQHDSAYTTSFTYRGNATSTTTPTSTTIRTFDIGGNVVTSKTNGVTTTTNTSTNSSTNYAAPGTLTTNSLTSSLQWSSFLGVTQATGPNGDVASMIYDAAARPSQSTSPYGAVTTYTYADSASPPYHQATTNNHWVQSQLDGFGRTVRAVTGYTSGSTNTTVSTVDTVYAPCGCSPMGKVSQVSLPYAPNGTEYWTTYTYDAIGRTTKVTLADGSATTYSYQGNTVAVTDAAGHVKTFTMDAFGNLMMVQETDPSLGAVTTTYTYDVLNHLIGVSMPRGSSNQPRTFNYNSGNTVTGLLQSATNPENGTVTYVYNSNNLLTSKTDAKNQQIQYTYDTYNRLTQVSHFPVKGQAEDTSQRVNYYYDTNPLDTTHTFSNYTSGRIAAVAYGPADLTAAPTFAEWYNYQISGLVATKRLQVNQAYVVQWPSVTDGSTSLNLDAAYTYDSGGEGKIASVAYPSGGPTYTYSFDSMYRPSGLKDQNNNTDVNNVVYNAANQLTSISYLGINESRTYNTLNQLTAVSATQGSSTLISKSYAYPTGANIGKIASQTDNISREVVQYTYDSLNRLLQASTSAGSPAWSQAFTYDPYGNLTAKTGTGGAPAIPTSAQPSSYDANGNVTTTYSNQFAYDVENRMTKWTNTIFGTPIATYAYDTQNRRVWQWNGAVDSNGTPVSYSVYYYGPNGQRLGAYTLNVGAVTTNGHITGYTLGVGTSTLDTYFGGRRLAPMDRLASAAKVGNQSVSFYPYGEDKGTAGANDSWKFATYWRDSPTTLDYAMNRYYSSGAGRFLTPDPYKASGGPSDPQSWNRYAYSEGDPTNFYDPTGLWIQAPQAPPIAPPGCDPDSDPLCSWGMSSFIFNELYLGTYTGSPSFFMTPGGGGGGGSQPAICNSAILQSQYLQIFAQMGKILKVNPLFIMAIALQESGWNLPHVYGTNSSSNGQPLNNLFGTTYAGGNNIPYASVQASALAWEQNWGAYLSNSPQTIQAFVNDLLSNPAHMYNTSPDYATSIIGGTYPVPVVTNGQTITSTQGTYPSLLNALAKCGLSMP